MATDDAKLSKRQYLTKKSTKYAKLSKKAVCGKNGPKNAISKYAKLNEKQFMAKKYAKLNKRQLEAKLSKKYAKLRL